MWRFRGLARCAMPPELDDAEEAARLEALQNEKLRSKVILRELREHDQELEKHGDKLSNPRSSALMEQFDLAQANVEKKKNVNHAVVDANIFCKLSSFSMQQATQLRSGLKDYDVASFVDKLEQLMEAKHIEMSEDGAEPESRQLDFLALGKNVWSLFMTAPSLQFMLGNEDIEPRAPKAGKRAARSDADKRGNAVRPKMVMSGENQAVEAEQQIARMKGVLQAKREVHFWRFVVDPNSYTRSIENVFHSSFLVKEGYAELVMTQDPPLIRYRSADEPGADDANQGSASSRRAESSQYIVRFDYRRWENVRARYDIRECMFPPTCD